MNVNTLRVASSGKLQVTEVLLLFIFKILKGDVFMEMHFLPFFSPVVGYVPESLQIDEGSDTTLTVEFLKPLPGAFGGQIIAPFLIDNTLNTGSLLCIHLNQKTFVLISHIYYTFDIRIH